MSFYLWISNNSAKIRFDNMQNPNFSILIHAVLYMRYFQIILYVVFILIYILI